MGNHNSILGGYNNTIGGGSSYCTIINGADNVIPANSENVHIIGDSVSVSSTNNNNKFYVGCANGLHCDGDIVAFSASDRRLKDNITPISGCLEKVLYLDAVEFEWNEKQQTHTGYDIGLIAQQVKEVAPEIVETRKDGYLAVKYEKIIPLLIGATQEQDSQIESLEKQVQELLNKPNC